MSASPPARLQRAPLRGPPRRCRDFEETGRRQSRSRASRAPDGGTAFTIALARGNEAVARLMLDYGADINTKDKTGSTPLHEAVRQGKIELVRDLVKRGADLHARTEPVAGRATPFSGAGGMTPFLTAAQTGNVAMMKELISLGADPTEKTPDGSDRPALRRHQPPPGRRKVHGGIRSRCERGPKARGSALHSAIRFGANEIIQYLADHGADFTIKDGFGRNAVEEADFEAPKSTIALVKKLAADRK